MKFSFIGLGKMGGSLARNLIRAGYDVVVFDISKEAMENTLKVGGRSALSAVEAAKDVDALFTSLPMPKDVETLLLGESGLYKVMKKGSTVIDVSTIDPATARVVADAAYKEHLSFLACPLGKGPAQAEQGTEPIFAGGQKQVYEKWNEVLNKIGNPVYYVGDVEQSTAFKLISNLVGMTNVIVMCEGMKLADGANIDPKLFLDLMQETGGDSYQLKVRGPWVQANDFAPRFAVNLALKDVRLGVEMAEAWQQRASFFKLALEHFNKSKEAGLGGEDCAAVYKIV